MPSWQGGVGWFQRQRWWQCQHCRWRQQGIRQHGGLQWGRRQQPCFLTQLADGFVSFTRTFQYLGSLITYNLRDDEDIKACIAAANASMGALKEIWSNPNLKTYNKYLLFWAIPMNILLWGCETWSLRQSLLDKLEVFMHKSIRRILQISITQVIKNKKIKP